MRLFAAFALAAAPIAVAATLAVPAAAQSQSGLSQVSAHLQAVNTMVADFAQTDRKGRTLTGTVTLKRPGKVRFEYEKGVPLLVVGDGKAITMIDYQVKQVSRWPIGNSPLAVLLDPRKDLSRVAKVVQNDARVLAVRARDPRRPEYGTITLAFTKTPGAPGGLMLHGWTMLDAQNARTTIRLANQRFNVAVADRSFRWTDPRGSGPRG
jgi:outer membrane lipoprotein-sorting protein